MESYEIALTDEDAKKSISVAQEFLNYYTKIGFERLYIFLAVIDLMVASGIYDLFLLPEDVSALSKYKIKLEYNEKEEQKGIKISLQPPK